MEAYEIRLELLRMAKDLLMEDWHSKRQSIDNVWCQKRDIAMSDECSKHVVDYPEIPLIPSSDEITSLAGKLNEFVSRKG